MTDLVAPRTAYLPVLPRQQKTTDVWMSSGHDGAALVAVGQAPSSFGNPLNISFTNESRTFTDPRERLRPACTLLQHPREIGSKAYRA